MVSRGELHGRHVLTERVITFIRWNYRRGNKGGRNHDSRFSLRGLGKRFGVSHRQIFRVLKGENWKHV